MRLKYPNASEDDIREKAQRWFDRQQATDSVEYVEWDWEVVAERKGVSQSPVWSQDGRFHFMANGKQILVHESTPPDYTLIATIPSLDAASTGHTGAITAFHLHPTNPLELITASLDGTVKIWSWTDGQLIRTLDVAEALAAQRVEEDGQTAKARAKIFKMAVGTESGKTYVYLEVNASNRDNHVTHKIVRVPMRIPSVNNANGETIPGSLVKHLTGLGQLNDKCKALQVSPHGNYISVATDECIYLRKLGHKASEWLKVSSEAAITCLAWCPSDQAGTLSLIKKGDEEWFATGDKGGVVRLYRGGLTQAFRSAPMTAREAWAPIHSSSHLVQLSSTPLHWHSHPVHALAFTPFGSQLLSGGEENVLVTWHLDTLKPTFMARLSVGASGFEWVGTKPVNMSIGAEGREEEYWCGFIDGSIVKIGTATNKVTPVGKRARINRLEKDLKADQSYPLAWHASTQSLILTSSHPSTLQFFQPSTSSLLYDLEIVPSNRVSGNDKEITPIRVSQVVLSPKTAYAEVGQWMATYETRQADPDQGGGKVRAIKLWYYSPKNGYVLNTHLDRVHGLENITSMSFAPAHLGSGDTRKGAGWYFLTAGTDGKAKVWTVKRGVIEVGSKGPGKKQSAQEEVFWALRSSFSYRPTPISSASFSPDGTLIALAQGRTVTLWSTSTNTLLRSLDSNDISHTEQITFAGEGGRWLVQRGQTGLAMWDLLSCGPAWTTESPKSDFVLAVANEIFTFASTKKVTKIDKRAVGSEKVLSRFEIPFGLAQVDVMGKEMVGLTRDGQVVRFGDDIAQFERTLPTRSGSTLGKEGIQHLSIWEEMFGAETFADVTVNETIAEEPSKIDASKKEKRGRYSTIYDGANASLPPSRLLFDAFIRDFMSLSLPSQVDKEEEPRVIVSLATQSVSGLGAGVRDVEKSRQGRMVPEKEVKSWFTNLVTNKNKEVATKAAPGPSQKVPSTPNVKKSTAPISTPLSGSIKKRRSKGGAVAMDVDTPVGSKRKAVD